jgi:hypothetical protein
LLFDFTFQTIDINVSLLALGLFWRIVPIIHSESSFCHQILNSILILFKDDRSLPSDSSFLLDSTRKSPPEGAPIQPQWEHWWFRP